MEVEAFLTYLGVQRQVAMSTQRQPLSALHFLYRQVLGPVAVHGGDWSPGTHTTVASSADVR